MINEIQDRINQLEKHKACRKVIYKTESQAKHSLLRINKSLAKKDRKILKDWYYCDFCKGWHLATDLNFMIKSKMAYVKKHLPKKLKKKFKKAK